MQLNENQVNAISNYELRVFLFKSQVEKIVTQYLIDNLEKIHEPFFAASVGQELTFNVTEISQIKLSIIIPKTEVDKQVDQ